MAHYFRYCIGPAFAQSHQCFHLIDSIPVAGLYIAFDHCVVSCRFFTLKLTGYLLRATAFEITLKESLKKPLDSAKPETVSSGY